jgi:hypothetical protein
MSGFGVDQGAGALCAAVLRSTGGPGNTWQRAGKYNWPDTHDPRGRRPCPWACRAGRLVLLACPFGSGSANQTIIFRPKMRRTGMGVARPLCVIHVPHRRDAVQENSRLDSLRPKLSEKIIQGALYRSNIAGEPNARPDRGSRVGSLCQFSRGRRLNYCIWQCRRLHRRAAASLAAPIFRNTCARCTSLRVQMTVPW